MVLSRRCALDGIWLDAQDSRIIIQGIEPQAGRDSQSATARGDGQGSRVTSEKREWLDIVIRFTVNEKSYRPEARAEVIEIVNAWAAKGGWLTVNYKPNRRVRVFLAQAAAEGDARTRGTYSLTLRACGVPWWQEENPAVLQRRGVSQETFVLGVNGSAGSVAEVTFKNTGGSTVNTLDIVTDEGEMHLTGLGLGNGETLAIDHEDTGRASWIRIRIQGTGGAWRSVLAARTPESADDLYLSPGNHSVTITAGGAGNMTLKCGGRWL